MIYLKPMNALICKVWYQKPTMAGRHPGAFQFEKHCFMQLKCG